MKKIKTPSHSNRPSLQMLGPARPTSSREGKILLAHMLGVASVSRPKCGRDLQRDGCCLALPKRHLFNTEPGWLNKYGFSCWPDSLSLLADGNTLLAESCGRSLCGISANSLDVECSISLSDMNTACSFSLQNNHVLTSMFNIVATCAFHVPSAPITN